LLVTQDHQQADAKAVPILALIAASTTAIEWWFGQKESACRRNWLHQRTAQKRDAV
jgi:hypothetical protein